MAAQFVDRGIDPLYDSAHALSGRWPPEVTAKTLMLGDDVLASMLGGIYIDVEKAMTESNAARSVQETRNEFQAATQDKFITAVEDLSGRRVLALISNHHVGPDTEIELVLATPGGISQQNEAAQP